MSDSSGEGPGGASVKVTILQGRRSTRRRIKFYRDFQAEEVFINTCAKTLGAEYWEMLKSHIWNKHVTKCMREANSGSSHEREPAQKSQAMQSEEEFLVLFQCFRLGIK